MSHMLPPGPAGLQYNQHPLEMLGALVAEYGPIVRYEVPFGATTIVNDPASVRTILYSPEIFRRSDVLSVVLGNGLLASEGEYWRLQRRRYQPKFHPNALRTYVEVMAEEAEITAAQWAPKAGTNEVLNLGNEMMEYSLRVASRIFLGVKMDSGPKSKALCSATSTVVTHLGQMGNTLARNRTPENNRNQRIALTLLDRVIGEIVEQRHNNPHGDDLLGALMQLRNDDGEPALTPEMLRDEVATMLLGGHETTAVSLTWSLWELARDAELAEQLCIEWRGILADDQPGWNHLEQLVRTQSFIREVLRLHPPVWSLVRKVLSDQEINGYHIFAGEHLMISPYLLHRSPDYWDEPEQFRADRFLAGIPSNLPRGSYIPFGAGPHTCIGQHVANIELLIGLSIWGRRFRFVPLDYSDPGTLPLITLRPGREILFRIEERRT